jgi:hypothetical protein
MYRAFRSCLGDRPEAVHAEIRGAGSSALPSMNAMQPLSGGTK